MVYSQDGEKLWVMVVLTWGAASSCVSGPPSSALSRVDDGSAAQRAPVSACGVAGSGDPQAGAGPVGHSYWRGGGQAEEGEGQRARHDLRGAKAVVCERGGRGGE